MINLNDKKYEDKSPKIFNGGRAGIVKDCDIRVEKKTKEDPENSPLFKLYIIDSADGEMNKGYYTNFKSEKAEEFFVREMKHLINVFRLKVPEAYDSYDEMLSTIMKAIKEKEGEVKVNVAVAYGTEAYPKRFLELDGFWGLMNVEDGVPRLNPNAILDRPAGDDETGAKVSVSASTDDEEW